MDVLGRLSVTSRTLTGAVWEMGDCREWILCTPNWIYHRMQNCRFFSNGTCTLHNLGIYTFDVPRIYRERQERGKQTKFIDLVFSDQGQLWQSGVQIWLDMWRWEDYGGRGTALVSRSGMEWDVMGGLVDTTQLTLPQPPSQPTDRQQQHSRWKLAPAPGLAFVKTHSFFKT